ncbi:uncharacterized protein J3R85_003521 [Psidium guajava]|nr:uncharacterized protein J3R85_003521 [Psidium guajava]
MAISALAAAGNGAKALARSRRGPSRPPQPPARGPSPWVGGLQPPSPRSGEGLHALTRSGRRQDGQCLGPSQPR